jgi:translation initiation factor 3 subunit A
MCTQQVVFAECALRALQVITEQQRARDEAEKKVHAMNRRMDHLERARREEEAPLLEQAYATKVSNQYQLLSTCSHPRLKSS